MDKFVIKSTRKNETESETERAIPVASKRKGKDNGKPIDSMTKKIRAENTCTGTSGTSDMTILECEQLDVQIECQMKSASYLQLSDHRNFRLEWLSLFDWLIEKKGVSFCKACQKELSNHLGALKRHEETPRHKTYYEAQKQQTKLDDFVQEKNRSLHKKIQHAELTLVMFLVSHNLPFLLMDYLPTLLKECCPDSQIAKLLHCGRTKSSTDLIKILANKASEKVISALRTHKFSLIIDETTDLSTKKALVLVVRYFDKLSKSVKDNFLAMIELASSDADAIVGAIKSIFQDFSIPLSNLLGLATDGASTMAGEINGVQAKLKQDVELFYMKCSCHSLHLCSSYACKKLPLPIEKLCRKIYNFFAYSSKRTTDFKEFQLYCQVPPHKILGVSQTRWLALEGVINRIVEQWDALKLYFISCCLEVNGVKSAEVAQSMDSEEMKAYFLFLSYILKIINNLNKEFQSEHVRLPYLYETMNDNFKLILSNFTSNSFVKSIINLSDVNLHDENNYIPIKEVFAGSKTDDFIKNSYLTEANVIKIKTNIRFFYVELLNQIKKRFDFSSNVLRDLAVITPEKFFSDPEASILPLISKFNHLVECNQELIVTQWRLLQLSNYQIKNNNIDKFWSEISNLKDGLDEYKYIELTNFVFDLMTLPHSSAAAERKFSELSLIKNKLRNSLSFKTINNIMAAKEMYNKNVKISREIENKKSEVKNYVWSAKDFFT